jgi:hypothetical protein
LIQYWELKVSGIDSIKIKGLDPNRRPSLKNKKYIDIFYELTQKAPRDWCADFNLLFSKNNLNAKIDPAEGLYVETWVRDLTHIQTELDKIKEIIKICNKNYIEKKLAEVAAAQRTADAKGVSGNDVLDKVLNLLDFD